MPNQAIQFEREWTYKPDAGVPPRSGHWATRNLINFYDFTNKGGDVQDKFRYAHMARVSAPSYGVRDRGYQMTFDGTDDYLRSENIAEPFLNDSPVSVLAVYRTTNNTSAMIPFGLGKTGGIVDGDEGTSFPYLLWVVPGHATQKVRATSQTNEDSTPAYNGVGAALDVATDDGEWHAIMGVWRSRLDISVHLDGLYSASGTGSGTAWDTATQMTIGARENNNVPSGQRFFNGDIALIAIFSEAFSDEQAGELCRATRQGDFSSFYQPRVIYTRNVEEVTPSTDRLFPLRRYIKYTPYGPLIEY